MSQGAGGEEAGPGLFVHRSNRSEVLVDELARLGAEPAASPFEPECVVVQGRGMERWLAMQLAQRLGVWANPDFPFPRGLVDRAFRAVLGEIDPAQAPFEPETMLWSVARLLPELAGQPAFAPIRDYLGGDDPRKLMQLSARLAQILDRYTVYRPELVLDWEAGQGGEDWQALLWRALAQTEGAAPGHTAALERAFHEKLRAGSGPVEGLPRRVILFGISALPPCYVRVLWSLARRLPIHIFVLSPSREYWADIRSRREILRARADQGQEEPAHDEEGNPLLASLGRLQRDFQRVLEVHTDYQEPERDLYREPTETGQTMLTVLQSDILALRHRHQGSGEAPPLQISGDDSSVTVHSCHGPTRELEVLHDQLRALFEADPTLEPRQVVVMTPEIETYAPLIEAVFGGVAEPRARIPFRVADRSARATQEVVDALMTLLEVLQGRLTAPAVLDLLTLEVVRAAFDIEAEELATIRAWVAEAGVRWGQDRDHRAAVGQPAYGENTWRFGLDRLLLGYAMPSAGSELFCGVLPYDDVEGSEALALGLLAELCEALFSFRQPLAGRHTAAGWQELLQRLLGRMVKSTEDNAHQHQRVRDALAALSDRAAAGGFDGELPLDAFRPLLADELERGGSARGFLAGGVTFCQLMPMRSIPFRVVCLLGMSDGAFPRSPQAPGFDRIAARPRVGDRTPRDDDRYLMLEALLSARERLLITYVGQSIQSNTRLPPSVLVGELLDTIEASFRLDPQGEGRDVRKRVVVAHPLQPFSPRYFGEGDDARLFSYSGAFHDGARSLAGQRVEPRPFLTVPLAEVAEEERVVTVDELARFFLHPARALLQRRLGLFLGEDEAAVDEREPLALQGLERWRVGTDLLARALQGEDLEQAQAAVRAEGALPLGAVGRQVYAGLSRSVQAVQQARQPWAEGEPLERVGVDAVMDGTRITGTLGDLWPAARLSVRYSGLQKPWELDVWVRHVILCFFGDSHLPRCSVAIGWSGVDAEVVRFDELEQPEQVLGDLLRLYWLGQQVPLPFFPRASRTYQRIADKLPPGQIHEGALRTARNAFTNDYNVPGESFDAHVQQVYGRDDPLDPGYRPCETPPEGYVDFCTAARMVFSPLFSLRAEVKR